MRDFRERHLLGSANLTGFAMWSNFEAGVVLGEGPAREAILMVDGFLQANGVYLVFQTARLPSPRACDDPGIAEMMIAEARGEGSPGGDLFMSLIHTCELNGVNSFDYLTELLRHAQELKQNPSGWMPWNYRDNPGSTRYTRRRIK